MATATTSSNNNTTFGPTPGPTAGPTSDPIFDLPSVEDVSQRIRDLNEQLIDSSKSAGRVTLDAYEKSLQSLVDFENKVASASQIEWVSAIATTQAKFITDLSTSFTDAARELLK